MNVLRRNVWIDAPAYVVWEFLHDVELRRRWDRRLVEFHRRGDGRPRRNSCARFVFQMVWPLRYSLTGRLIAFEPSSLMSMRFGQFPRWTGVDSAAGVWSLTNERGGTRFQTTLNLSMRWKRLERFVFLRMLVRRLERVTEESLQRLKRLAEQHVRDSVV